MLIFSIDEPTTGLDAKTALNVMTTIEKLAKSGRAIVLTIHQPRSDIFQMFDKLLLLARGRTAYFGSAAQATNYFAGMGHICSAEYNPADFLIDLVAELSVMEPEGKKKKQNEKIESILNHYNEERTIREVAPRLNTESITDLSEISVYQSFWIVQTVVLFVRAIVNMLRDGILTGSRIGQSIVMALLVGLIYLRTQYFQSNVQDRIGVLFFIVVVQVMGSIFAAVSTFPTELAVFLRERGSKTYRVSSYFVGKTLADVPHQVIFPTIFGVIAYWMIGLNPGADRFFIFLLTNVVISVTAQSFGLLLSALIPSAEAAMGLSQLLTTVMMVFGGFYMNVVSIPVYFVWIYWISFFHFGFEALVLNEFAGASFSCRDSEFINGTVCPIQSGQQVIANLNMTSVLSNVWINLAFLCAGIVFCRIGTYLALRFVRKPRAA